MVLQTGVFFWVMVIRKSAEEEFQDAEVLNKWSVRNEFAQEVESKRVTGEARGRATRRLRLCRSDTHGTVVSVSK